MYKTMDNKWMYNDIPNDDTQNYPFYGIKLVVKMFDHSS